MTIIYIRFQKRKREFEKALKALENGKVDRHVYNAFNYSLVSGGYTNGKFSTSRDAANKFYEEMRKSGYGIVMDMNDKKFSVNIRAKEPLIVFDKTKLSDPKLSRLGTNEIDTYARRYATTKISEFGASTAGKVGAAASAVAIGTTYSRSISNDKIVQRYRNEHPNTKLSYNEILRMERTT